MSCTLHAFETRRTSLGRYQIKEAFILIFRADGEGNGVGEAGDELAPYSASVELQRRLAEDFGREVDATARP